MSHSNTKGSHLTIENREFIEDALNMKLTLKEIAEHLYKDKTTISKEIKRSRMLQTRKLEHAVKSCAYKTTCKKQHVCGNVSCNKVCKRCNHYNCFSHCENFKQSTCKQLDRFPHVCNGCNQKIGCRLLKYKYRAKDAQQRYESQLVESRTGIDLSPAELKSLDQLITPLVEKGQSLKHIHVNHEDQIKRSQRSLYNYFEMNLFTVRNIDLPRKVKCKPRKKKQPEKIRNTTYNIDRKYQDYLNYMTRYPDTQVVQMDTVYNAKSGPGILTLYFVGLGLMIGYCLESLTIECVTRAIDSVHESVGDALFKDHFQLLLTDNGSEFKSPERLELGSDNTKRTKVFYCEPYASYQKAQIENNHGFIREILPKKHSFGVLTQEKVTLMMNHINSVSRKSLNDKTAYATAEEKLGLAFMEKLNLKLIQPDEVHLKPALLK